MSSRRGRSGEVSEHRYGSEESGGNGLMNKDCSGVGTIGWEMSPMTWISTNIGRGKDGVENCITGTKNLSVVNDTRLAGRGQFFFFIKSSLNSGNTYSSSVIELHRTRRSPHLALSSLADVISGELPLVHPYTIDWMGRKTRQKNKFSPGWPREQTPGRSREEEIYRFTSAHGA
jgi:hypothetical protein